MKFDFYKILGIVGLLIMAGVAIYLILKIIGVIHSASVEEVFLALVVGQVFYSGYTFRAIQGIEKSTKRTEERTDSIECRLLKIEKREEVK
ncbi:hypothetical protein KKD19_02305 [Patescibacteria group bacterium]|nr:hypothetical protein [Patescibacteria group bacterium]MBU4512057.1 hypothetical protein [Patescibacteria group bacterium]MCG2692685.1 hypothetical protein [Candidatus Parcubacteria bacterium]